MKYLISLLLIVLFSTSAFAVEVKIPQGYDMKNVGSIICSAPDSKTANIYVVQFYEDNEEYLYGVVDVMAADELKRLGMVFLSTSIVDDKPIVIYTTRQLYDPDQTKAFTFALYPGKTTQFENNIVIPALFMDTDNKGKTTETEYICFSK